MQDFFHQQHGDYSVDILASTHPSKIFYTILNTFKRPYVDALHLQVWYRHLRKKETSNGCVFLHEVNLSNSPRDSKKPKETKFLGKPPNEHENTHHLSISFMSVFQMRFQDMFFNHHHRTCHSFLVEAYDI